MIKFYKYHGLGNDFVMCHYEDVVDLDFSVLAKKVCNRHTSLGADGLIIVKKPYEMIYYNSDGSKAAMCGNGIRCTAAFIYNELGEQSNQIDVKTLHKTYTLYIDSFEPYKVKVDMGNASFKGSDIPSTKERIIDEIVTIDRKEYHVSAMLLGVPHAVVKLDELNIEEMKLVSDYFMNHEWFIDSVNVNFYVEQDDSIYMQTVERGAGLTLACGTGATAVYAYLHHIKGYDGKLDINLPLGSLSFEEIDGSIYKTGPAIKVYEVLLNEEELV